MKALGFGVLHAWGLRAYLSTFRVLGFGAFLCRKFRVSTLPCFWPRLLLAERSVLPPLHRKGSDLLENP